MSSGHTPSKPRRSKTEDIPEDVVQVWSEQEERRHHKTEEQIKEAEKRRLDLRPQTHKAIWEHAYKGGIKAFILAFGVRAGVTLCLQLLRVVRGKQAITTAFKNAVGNGDARRFASVIGGYAFLWKGIANLMRVERKKDDRLNSAVAGGIASIALIFEKKDTRVAIAQQMFVRALQALYNAGKSRDYVDFPNGDVLLFSLTCAQVMYAYVMNPDSMPPAYNKFMLDTAMVPKESLELVRNQTRGGPIVPSAMVATLTKYSPTQHALEVLNSISPNEQVLPCEVIHPDIDGCLPNNIGRWFAVFKMWLPIYSSLHFIPTIILRLKAVLKDPKRMFIRTSIGSLRSSAFLATFVVIYQAAICIHRNLYHHAPIPGIRNILPTSKYMYWFFGLLPGLSLFIEEKRRRSELAMYVTPKALESIWRIWQSHRVVPHIPYGEVYLAAIGMSTIMTFYQKEPECLSSLLQRVMFRLMGTN